MDDCFFNNDLAYLQGGSTGGTYTNSLTKTKAAKYNLPGIEDMRVSKHDVYSIKRILVVTNVKVKERYGYDHLEEIKVQRSDQQLYKFMEGDLPQLYLHDIEDMLILFVQNRLFNLKGDIIVHLAATLRRNSLMCSHEFYKFSVGTLISLRDTLKDIANNLEMGYTSVMPRRRWSNMDRKRSHIMIKDIYRQLLDRRLMRSLKKFIGGREYGEIFDCFSEQYDFVISCSTL
ncbi:hypothetical protein Tco_0788476 [Tanacetum coccineum]